jgi:ATP-dependent Clp endopeptidase proteolytic subunit ClpP
MGLSAEEIQDQINALGSSVKRLHVYINSPGGSVFEGATMYNAIKEWRRKVQGREVITHVMGMAASMGSILAMVGDKVLMHPMSQIMIHNPRSASVGQAKDLRATADLLDSITEQLIQVYQRRMTHLDKDGISALMEKESWFTAASALDIKLADGIMTDEPSAQHFAPTTPTNDTNDTTNPTPMNNLKLIAAAIAVTEGMTEAQAKAAFDSHVRAEVQAAVAAAQEQLLNQFIGLLNLPQATTEALKAAAAKSPEAALHLLPIAVATATPDDTATTTATNPTATVPAVPAIADQLKAIATTSPDAEADHELDLAEKFDKLQRHNPKALQDLKRDKPAEFDKLVAAYTARIQEVHASRK